MDCLIYHVCKMHIFARCTNIKAALRQEFLIYRYFHNSVVPPSPTLASVLPSSPPSYIYCSPKVSPTF